MTLSSNRIQLKGIKRKEGRGEAALTSVDGSHEVLDLALLAEHERGQPGVRRARRRRGEVGVEGDPGGVVAAVLEAAEAVEEDLEDVAALPRHVVVEVGEDPAHPGRRWDSQSQQRCSTSREERRFGRMEESRPVPSEKKGGRVEWKRRFGIGPAASTSLPGTHIGYGGTV
jgi:hypothetical protein